MKKLLLLTITLIFALVGCTANNDIADDDETINNIVSGNNSITSENNDISNENDRTTDEIDINNKLSDEAYNAAIAAIDAANAYIARPESGMWNNIINTEAYFAFRDLEEKQALSNKDWAIWDAINQDLGDAMWEDAHVENFSAQNVHEGMIDDTKAAVAMLEELVNELR